MANKYTKSGKMVGRPPKGVTEARQAEIDQKEREKRERAAERRATMRETLRKTGALMNQNLFAPHRKGYKRRWVNDEKGRVEKRLQQGYDFVELTTEEQKLTSMDTSDGHPRKRVGTQEGGQPLYAYLMEIPEEFHKQDHKEYVQTIADSQQSMLNGNIKGRTPDSEVWSGEVKIS